MDKRQALKTYFGHSSFRPGQEALIDALLSGRDALGVMPTGAGKSVCYQLPALLLPGVTVVLSPLISLMADQVAALQQAGIEAAFLNSSLSADEYREVLRRAYRGEVRLLYVAPERLTAPAFLRFAQSGAVSLLAVDEAHCVSQWGQDFRPSYLGIADFLSALPRRPVVAAFTATATARVQEDVCRLLRLQEPLRVTTGFDRPNLFFDVMTPRSKDACLLELLRRYQRRSGIVYCATRAKVEHVCQLLQDRGLSATRYHAGLSDEERRQNQEDFVFDRRLIMVATNAFGMGIDKSNVGFVLHYNMPKNIESYYQEAGGGGRDGSPADCVLLFRPGDVRTARHLIENGRDNEALSEEQRETIQAEELGRLEQMVAYCKTQNCLRACLLRYFGEDAPPACGHCGTCKGSYVQQDITVEAQKILSCVARVERKFSYGLGMTMYIRILSGSKEQRLVQMELDQLPTYGLLSQLPRNTIRDYIEHLISLGYLTLSQGEYPVLALTPSAKGVLFRKETVTIPVRQPSAAAQADSPRQKKRRSRREDAGEIFFENPDDALLERLRSLRFRLAKEAQVPAYVIFSNATLSAMAAQRPATTAELLEISGVGEKRAFRYGEAFLSVIREFCGS